MAEVRSAGRGVVGTLGGMVSDVVLGAAERVVRPERDGAAPPAPAPPAAAPPAAAPSPRVTGHVEDAPDRGLGGLAASVVGRTADAVIERIDLDALLARVDLDRVLERVDVNRVLARVDVDAALDRVDPDRLLERVDVDRLVERIDVGPLAREAVEGLDLGEIVRESSLGLGGEVIRDARLQGMRADRAVEGVVDRLLGREPRGAVIPAPGRATSRAGIVSRTAATLVDTMMVVLAGLALLLVIASVRLLWTGDFEIGFIDPPVVRIGAVVLLLAYLAYGWGLDGRTAGKALMGLRVLDEDGSDMSFRRALVRALLVVVFPVGLLWSAVSAQAASLQDLVVSSVVVHDWGRERTPERPPPRRRRPGSPQRD